MASKVAGTNEDNNEEVPSRSGPVTLPPGNSLKRDISPRSDGQIARPNDEMRNSASNQRTIVIEDGQYAGANVASVVNQFNLFQRQSDESNWMGEVNQPPPFHEWKEKAPENPSVVVFDRKGRSLVAFEPEEKSWWSMQSLHSNMIAWNMTAVRTGNYIYAFLENKCVFRIEYANGNRAWEVEDEMLLEHGDLPPTTVLEGYIYAIGQSQPTTSDPRRAERFDFDETRTWLEIPGMRTKRIRHTVVACKGNVYSIGGIDGSVARCETADDRAEKFDPVTQEWSAISPMNGSRYGASATALLDKIYIFGGAKNGRSRLTEAEVYDTNADAWTRIADMNVPRCYFGATTVNGKIYAVNGHSIFPLTIEEYDTQKEKWKIVADDVNMKLWPSACVSI